MRVRTFYFMSKNHIEVVVGGFFVFVLGTILGSHLYSFTPSTDQLGSVGTVVARPSARSAQSSFAPQPVSSAPSATPASQQITPTSENNTVSAPQRQNIPFETTLTQQVKRFTGLKAGDQNLIVRDLQNRLGSLGFFEGKATGYFGKVTAQAITSFQSNNSLSVTGLPNQETIGKLLSSNLSSGTGDPDCNGPVYAGTEGFPPHGPTNPYPPQDLPVVPGPYVPGVHVCRHFANQFCQTFQDRNPGQSCSLLSFDHHTINKISFTDSTGQKWVCAVEPQTNESVCKKQSEWTNDWIRNILCKSIYRNTTPSLEDCDNVPIADVPAPLQQCSAVVGGACLNGGPGNQCIDDVSGDVRPLWCKHGKWTYWSNSGPEICPDSPPQHGNDELVPFWKNRSPICWYAEPILLPQDNS